ncbi:gelsolin [Geosmithia morbida]|uniref:Gelsolin n=1 Tax=Geosmithia morbida TaxID=1094350 RepID=A0A9P5D2M6_9HYPO|nr:gelsolin [Geosmithia morbida]KAF4121621.1 gelsolin [Geosmithia morbida]
MAPHDGLIHPKEYDIKDSNVELISSDLDHKVRYNSAATEPAWNDGKVGRTAGLYVWRIEEFQVVPWPEEKYGQFYNGDSYIVLYSYKVGSGANEKLCHDIFFWLGAHTTQDEAGTAAYKTVELDEFMHGAATQHREIQDAPSDEFLSLFPRLTILKGGVRSGFRHVEQDAPREDVTTLLRVFKNPASSSADGVVVYEVEPTWRSLDDSDVFVLDKGDKIWVWQGKDCSPMEKAKAAQVVHDMTLAKHIDVEVLAQSESRSVRVVDLLGGDESTPRDGFYQPRPLGGGAQQQKQQQQNVSVRLFRLSDASGQLSFELAKEGSNVSMSDLDGNDVFLLDLGGRAIWIWEGKGASLVEKAQWLHVARAYVQYIQSSQEDAYLIPLAKVNEGHESKAFLQAVAV